MRPMNPLEVRAVRRVVAAILFAGAAPVGCVGSSVRLLSYRCAKKDEVRGWKSPRRVTSSSTQMSLGECAVAHVMGSTHGRRARGHRERASDMLQVQCRTL
jgi:hypothetical protein